MSGPQTKWDFPIICSHATVSNGAAGTSVVIPAVANKKGVVFAIVFSTGVDDLVNFASNAVAKGQNIITKGGVLQIMGYNPVGWMKSETGQTLTFATAVGAYSFLVVYGYEDV